jgi:hypothetical protein
MGILSDGDIQKILTRNPDLEIARLWDGLRGRKAHRHQWSWEKKYKLNFSKEIVFDELAHAYGLGMLPKTVLDDGQFYWGVCRNARVARWSAAEQRFFHRRKKGSHWFTESIPHPSDAVAHEDLFIPWLQVEPLPHEMVAEIPGGKR